MRAEPPLSAKPPFSAKRDFLASARRDFLAALPARLMQAASAPRPREELARVIAAAHDTALAQAKEILARQPAQGRAAAGHIARTRHALARALYQAAAEKLCPNPNPSSAEVLTLAAAGGFGRGLCAPYSDMDLFFLIPYKPTPWCESMIESILYPLWDAGLKLGHSVWRPQSAVKSGQNDVIQRTTLLDARFLAGDENMFRQFSALFARAFPPAKASRFAAAKLAEREARHQQSGNSRYMVEPDVKQGKGGLRDLQTLLWLAKTLHGVSDSSQLAAKGILTAADARRFRSCENLLWAVRCQLHFAAGRAEEKLSFDRQPVIAHAFGYGAASAQNAAPVERFMKRYFVAAKHVGDLTRIFSALMHEESHKARWLGRLRARRFPALSGKTSGDFALTPAGAAFYRPRGRQADKSAPLAFMRLFAFAARRNAAIHPVVLAQAQKLAPVLAAKLRSETESGQLFLAILQARGGERVLRRMSEAGWLTRFIPAFGRLAGLMQFNMYHHYTADEHLLRAVGCLNALERKRRESDDALRRPRELMRTLSKQNREILYLAIFCHDIAKGGKEDHSLAGGKIAQTMALRFGFSAEAAAQAAFLVREHLAMSTIAQTRDLSDSQPVREFAELVQTPGRLTLLYLLTIADIQAVGPGVWNGWKAALLAKLYDRALRSLAGGEDDAAPLCRNAGAQLKLEMELAGWPAAKRKAWLALLPNAYWRQTPPSLAAIHAGLWQRFSEAGNKTPFLLAVEDLPQQNASQLVLLAGDHAGLFARAAAAFALAGLDVVEARVFTARDGTAFDTFFVQRDGRQIGESEKARLEHLLHTVFSGRLNLEKEFARASFRRRSARLAPFPARPEISIDNDAAQSMSVISVNALNRPALLFFLASALFRAGLLIHGAQIACFGERAVDNFYVTAADGQKITQPQRRAAVRRALLAALEK